MDALIKKSNAIRATITVPSDKAICHRAILISAIAKGKTNIRPWPDGDDCKRTLELIQQLGISAARSKSKEGMVIEGRGLYGMQKPAGDLCCGESGTTIRLAAGILAGHPFETRLSAGPSLSKRPMRRIIDPLSQMGARISGTHSNSSEECFPPLSICGRRPLNAIRYEMNVPSAQVKSSILLAGLYANGKTTVVERYATRDHTERMLRHAGIRVSQDGLTVTMEPGKPQLTGELVLPGDFSSAAFFIVAASCVAGSHLIIREIGLNPTRSGLLKLLKRMGAVIREDIFDDSWEPRGSLEIEARPLNAITVSEHEVPLVIDELPVLMIAAACAKGITCLRGVAELRLKETDRVSSMVSALSRLGARIRLLSPDVIEIEGGGLSGAIVDSSGDHRTAMSLAVAGLVSSGTTVIRNAQSVEKSFPDFFKRLGIVCGSSTVKTVDKF